MSTRNVFAKIILKDMVSSGATKVNASLNKTHKSAQVLNGSLGMLNGTMLGSAAGFVAMTAAFFEFKTGLTYVEDLNQSIVTMTGFISSFSKAGQEGNFALAFKEANEYASALIPKLEIMDAKTIATGRDLTLMAETMAQYGVWIDLNNKKQEDGFINMANALAMLTAGQNKQIQMRQEMHALLAGQMRMTDRLPKILDKLIPNMKQQIALWIENGEAVEKIGEKLKGFGMVVPLIQEMWAAVGTTMSTIHRRILRGGLEPAYKELLGLAQRFNDSMVDTDGNLKELAITIQDYIGGSWIFVKNRTIEARQAIDDMMPAIDSIRSMASGLTAMFGEVNKNINLISIGFTGLLTIAAFKVFNSITASVGRSVIAMRSYANAQKLAAAATTSSVAVSVAGMGKLTKAQKLASTGMSANVALMPGYVSKLSTTTKAVRGLSWAARGLGAAMGGLPVMIALAATEILLFRSQTNALTSSIENQNKMVAAMSVEWEKFGTGRLRKNISELEDGLKEARKAYVELKDSVIGTELYLKGGPETPEDLLTEQMIALEKVREIEKELFKRRTAMEGKSIKTPIPGIKTEIYLKQLQDAEKASKKFNDAIAKIHEGSTRAIYSAEKQMAKDNFIEKIALRKEYWDKRTADDIANTKKAFLANEKVLIAGQQASFDRVDTATKARQRKERATFEKHLLDMARAQERPDDTASEKNRRAARNRVALSKFVAKQEFEVFSIQEEWKEKSLDYNDKYQEEIAATTTKYATARLDEANSMNQKGLDGAIKNDGKDLIRLNQHFIKVQEMHRKNAETVKGMMHGLGRGLMDEQQTAIDDLMTSYAKAVQQMNQLEFFVDDPEQVARIQALRAEYGEKFVQDLKKLQFEATNTGKVMKEVEGSIKTGITETILDAGNEFRNFGDIVSGVLKNIARQIIETNLSTPISAGVSSFVKGLFTPSADGNVFSGPGISAYSNTIVSKPTLFPFANGIGLMGEAGEEAILPLKRGSGGKLGVQAEGVGGGDLIINYSPVIQAIDTRSGLQFLASHAQTITGIINREYAKIGRKGIAR